MRSFAALLLVLFVGTVIASCGGGSSSSPADTVASAPLIRYQGSWRAHQSASVIDTTQPASLTIQALSGQATISANPVARVEMQIGQGAPIVLTAANSTDAAGQPQYVFEIGAFPPTSCLLQIGITVVDVTGFAYTKHITGCPGPGGEINFGAFSDYGTTSVQFAYTASTPISASISRKSTTGYLDSFAPASQASFSATLPAADGDQLLMFPKVPSGTRVRSRIDGGGGSFAESTTVAPVTDVQSPLASLDCCGARLAVIGSAVDVGLRIFSGGQTPAQSYTYSFRITDPATGSVIGNQTGTTFSVVNFPALKVQRGYVIEMEATPNAPGGGVDISANLGRFGGGSSVTASSNEVGTPARFKVFCCSP